jgi:hypothetical protein
MSHKANASESSDQLELVESEKRSDEKFKTISKDILGLKAESDLVLFNHIPEIVEKLELIDGNIIILRDDHADTNRLVRKMYYDMLPALHEKVDILSGKVDTLCNKLDKFLNK